MAYALPKLVLGLDYVEQLCAPTGVLYASSGVEQRAYTSGVSSTITRSLRVWPCSDSRRFFAMRQLP
jgi:hypothetical protein